MEAYEGNENYIFISYAHKDREKMLWFAEELQKYCNVWYDNGIHAGNEWADKLADKIANCSLFLFLVSPNSLASDNCKDELALARDSGKPFVNIRLSDISFSGGMQLRYGRYQYFDLFEYEDASQAVKELLKGESFTSLRSKQDVLKAFVNRTKTMMAHTEENSLNIDENNSDFFVRFRTADTTVPFGKYMDKPIEWDIKLIQKDRAVLVSKEIIETMAFSQSQSVYAESTVRSWLNTAFMDIAFDEEEKKLLCPLTAEDQTDATDRVFLLSQSQALELFKSDKDRMKCGTDHAKENGLLTNASGDGWWWLSSTDTCDPRCVHRVYSNGRIGFDTDFDNESIGVVPMIIVKIC